MSVLDLRAYCDGGPKCVDTVNSPILAARHGDRVQAVYLCPECDHVWTCGWSARACATPTGDEQDAA